MGKAKEYIQPEYEQQAFDLVGIERPVRRLYTTQELFALHRALEPFIDLNQLRRFAAEGYDLHEALRVTHPPTEIRALMTTITAVLRQVEREQIKSPTDIAALLYGRDGLSRPRGAADRAARYQEPRAGHRHGV